MSKSNYKVAFIDGHDLKFKEWYTEAADVEEAKVRFWHAWGAGFEHHIVYVKEDGVIIYEG